jgi:hypothetical protein
MTIDLTYFILSFAGGIVFGVVATASVVYWQGETIIHRMKYKVHTLPCPNCRNEDDEPTGEVTPENDMLRRMAKEATESGELPTFPCQVCEGTKVISYEFPRHSPPMINERQIITSPLPGQMPTKRRRRTL